MPAKLCLFCAHQVTKTLKKPHIPQTLGHKKASEIRLLAEITGFQLPDNAGEDSVSLLPDLLGTATQPIREAIVHHSVNGSFSIRQGKWKLELCPGSGGWSFPRPKRDDMSEMPRMQLYDLDADISEMVNVIEQFPAVVTKLSTLLNEYITNVRITPGILQKNYLPTCLPHLWWI